MAKAKQLTERQQEITALLDDGKTPREIAAALEITENAVYQHIRRIRANGTKISTSGTGRAAAARTRRSSAPKPTLAPATRPTTELRDMTPLQAIRARKDALAHDVREADHAVAAAERALKAAQERATKIKTKHGDELKALEKAESAITGKPVTKVAPGAKPTGTAKSRSRSRSSAKRTSSNGSTPAGQQQGQQEETTPAGGQQQEPAPTA